VRLYLQPGGPDTIRPLTPDAPSLQYRLEAWNVTIEFQPTDFVQINGALNEAMVAQALAQLDLQPTDRVLDLFCGLGNFSLPIARTAAQSWAWRATPASSNVPGPTRCATR
jgi:23S rRNA (uracil1939-C5)-methyltransferase